MDFDHSVVRVVDVDVLSSPRVYEIQNHLNFIFRDNVRVHESV